MNLRDLWIEASCQIKRHLPAQTEVSDLIRTQEAPFCVGGLLLSSREAWKGIACYDSKIMMQALAETHP
jgi:hypothetical protein